ncbi:hypothetical protein [Nocardia sp. NPDC051463]|uniref:hypothetical protein n=1 Tax=Nocardia sp. NPDC051463 TaxID=3154845 RepID=UPI00344B0D9D
MGFTLFGIGLIGAAAFLLTNYLQVGGDVDNLQRFDIPGSGTMSLAESHEYTVYLEYPGAATSVHTPKVSVTITGQDGTVPLHRTAGTTYDVRRHNGASEYTFQVPRSGTYVVTTQGDSGAGIAIGRGILGSVTVMILGTLGIGAAGTILGGAAFLVVLFKRIASKKRPLEL